MELETSRGALAPAKKKNLPVRILRAFDSAKHMLGIGRSVKDTFAEICRFVPQSEPFATVFAHKAKIAERIGASERTVYRHLAELVEHGLIEVLEQERKSRNGRFSVARIRLTRKAAALLGLIEAETEEIHSLPPANLSAGQSLTEPTIAKNHPAPRMKNGLPMELAHLTGMGLSRAGIFALMAKAKAHGKLLSDITTAAADRIADLKGGKLFAYLAKLATGKSDFAVQAATIRRQQVEAEQGRALARKCAVFRERFANAVLTNRAQTKLYLIDAKAKFAQVIAEGARFTTPIKPAEWVEAIEAGRVVLATLDTERRLCAQ